MHLNWIDTRDLSFNSLLLLERVQLSWFPGWVPERELAVALDANPVVEWYIRHKCPEVADWLDGIKSKTEQGTMIEVVYDAEQLIMQSINDLLTYAIDPGIYDKLDFLNWDSSELTGLVDFQGKLVLDIGSGTGRLAFTAAPGARVVFAVEPVGNLRMYIKQRAEQRRVHNVYPVDGLLTEIPFPENFADVCMGGFVFGETPEEECNELERVTKSGGMVILCPGNVDKDNPAHEVLVKRGYHWSRFDAPGNGFRRKYWKKLN